MNTHQVLTKARAVRRRMRPRQAAGTAQPETGGSGLKRRLAQQDREIQALRRKLAQLETEIDETRRLHQRVAELTDVVAEILVPLADRDDARIKKALETFAKTSF